MNTEELKAKLAETVVLIADDDALVREIMIEHLKAFGFQHILEAKNGSVALKFVRDAKQQIDLCISDWEMPQADGLVLLKAIRNNPQRQTVKFIMVTSQNSRERAKISQAARLNVDGYIIKPFRGDMFKERIFSALGWSYKFDGSGEAA